MSKNSERLDNFSAAFMNILAVLFGLRVASCPFAGVCAGVNRRKRLEAVLKKRSL
jgi:hypothetical protein